ncbi:hypothetical protein QL285_078005 [Trifolium repens]|nr:hypothetical protein QL285_078005 [Trifolium repens]
MNKHDKRWMKLGDVNLPEYVKGINYFLEFAFSGPEYVSGIKTTIRCPCRKCNNVFFHTRADTKKHLLRWGFEPSYEKWELHGEKTDDSSSSNDRGSKDEGNDFDDNLETSDDAQTYSMLHDMYQSLRANRDNVCDHPMSNTMEEPNEDAIRFYGLLKDGEEKLYPGCQKFSKLSFIMRIFQMKCLYGWSNTSFDSLLKLLSEALPEGNVLPDSIYLTDMDSRLNRPERYMDYSCDDYTGLSVFENNGRPIGGDSWENMSLYQIQQAHFYILQNCEEVRPWIEEHMTMLRNENGRNVDKRHKEQFHKWFEKEVVQLQKSGDKRITSQLVALARGPDSRVCNYSGYFLNGFKFRTKDSEIHLKTQNSGVIVRGDELAGHIDYYGVIKTITEVRYMNRNLYYRNDPFILGSQAGLVYYVRHSDNEKWHTVVKVKPRSNFDLPCDVSSEPYQLNELGDTHVQLDAPLVDQDDTLHRDDVGGISLEEHIVNQEKEAGDLSDDEDTDTEDDEDESSTYEDTDTENTDSDTE